MLFKLAALVSFRDRYDLLKAKAPEEASAWVRESSIMAAISMAANGMAATGMVAAGMVAAGMVAAGMVAAGMAAFCVVAADMAILISTT